MKVLLAGFFCLPSLLLAQSAHDLGTAIRKTEFDPEQCYRVRDLSFTREDLRFYFNDGHIIFARPAAGRVFAALFMAAEEHGDAELLLLPPSRGERVSLASFTGAPNLNEHFTTALMLFTDDTADHLLSRLRAGGDPVRSSERGLLLAREWNSVLGNLSSSFLIRIVQHFLNDVPDREGFFYAAVAGGKLGNFDAFLDPERHEEIYLGKLAYRDNRAFYDTWTSYRARSRRGRPRDPGRSVFTLSNYRIEAVLESDLLLRVNTQVTLTPRRDNLRALLFDISAGMKVGEVRINGEPAEVYSPESLRANLIRHLGSTLLLIVPAQPLAAGRSYELEFAHEGHVVSQAGKKVFYVGARGNWYPQSGLNFSHYDLTFTYPAGLQLVFPGVLKEDNQQSGIRTTRRVSGIPIRIAGFNLGDYEEVKVARGQVTVEIYANREVEEALRQKYRQMIVITPVPVVPPVRGAPRRQEVLTLPPQPPPDPTARLQSLGEDIATAFSLLAEKLGPPALSSLTVAPVPGSFGQGYPGLIYLSTLSYLEPRDRPGSASRHQLFFDEVLASHETAHQWWGNVVTADSPQDEWLMEALANYSALLVLEKKKGVRALYSVLDQYRADLLEKGDGGHTLDASGAIRLGPRLRSSISPGAWNTIVYEKGSWIIHMLRRRMGDDAFWKFLAELVKRYRYKGITTDDFQKIAAEFLPSGAADPKLESFFESWVHGTGIPSLTLTSAIKGKPPRFSLSFTVSQSGVEDHFSALVPVVVHPLRSKPLTIWVPTGKEPETVTLNFSARPARVQLDPDMSVLASRD